ncbi:MAG: hypothetical protein GXO29_06500, partial [Thermotogae bacterium]|nr:hypothetical protein [Thermotogota bacterium]
MGVAVAEKPKGKEKDERRERLLRLLTYEVVDGRPIYYRGYKKALELMLSGEQPEESMGASFWHSDLLASLIWFLKNELGSAYRVVGGE